MHGKMRRGLMAFVMAMVAAVGVLSAGVPTAKAEACDFTNYAPDIGSIRAEGPYNGSSYAAVFQFKLTGPQVTNLRCMDEYLEIDFHLYNFGVGTRWEGYSLGSNIRGAMHDTADGDDSPTEQIPGATNIRTADLDPDTPYYVAIYWSAPNAQANRAVGIGWTPSYWAYLTADPGHSWELPLCAAHQGIAPWCIFGDQEKGHTYDLTYDKLRSAYPPAGHLPFTTDPNHWYSFGGWNGAPYGGNGWGGSLAEPYPATQSGPPPPVSTQMFIRGDSAVLAKNDLADGGWTQETGPGSAKAIAAAGSLQMVLDPCNAVWAKDSVSDGGWVQETPCYGATQIAISSTGLQMLVDANSAVFAKYGIGSGGWTRETTDGNAAQIAVGGDTQMFIRGDSAVLARTGIGDSWVQETTPGNATAIAADATGMQAFIRGDAAVFARRGIGTDWQQQVGPGNAGAIAAGGGVLMFLRGDSAVFAKTNISNDGGWTQETEPATANAIAVGENGRQMLRTGNAAIWAKDGVGYGGWSQQVGDGNAAAIDVG